MMNESTNTEKNNLFAEIEPIDEEKASADELYNYYNSVTDTFDQNQVGKLVKKVSPTIDYTLHSLNVSNDPVLKAEAKAIAADGIRKFDPDQGVGLNTYLSSHLKQMTRKIRDRNNAVKIPERQQIDMYELGEAEKDFIEEKGREPNLDELADVSGIPVDRVKRVKKNMLNSVGENKTDFQFTHHTPDFTEEAIEYVYHDVPHKDKKIIEHYFGFGNKQLPPGEISKKLNISPSQVSRRSAALALKIQEIENALKQN